MKAELKIKDFGPIKEANLDLRQTTVFIGPQASGKSTIAKLITLSCRAIRTYAIEIGYNLNKELSSHNLSSFLNENSLITFREKNSLSQISIENSHAFIKSNLDEIRSMADRVYDIIEICDEIRVLKNQSDFNPLKSRLRKAILSFEKNEKTLLPKRFERDFSNMLEIVSNDLNKLDKSLVSNILEYFKELQAILWKMGIIRTYYIPAERIFVSVASGSFINLVNNEVPIPKNILEFGSLFEKARNLEREVALNFLGIDYRYENGEDRVYWEEDKYVALKEASSGQQNAVPMLVVIEALNKYPESRGNTLFIIEEPELNLFPLAQKDLTYFLAKNCTYKHESFNENDELILTTHSPYVLTALNNLLFAYKVAQRHPEKAEEVKKIIPAECWINPDDFNAYFVANGTVEQIFNRNTGMISENELDSGSDEILEDFDALMEIYKLPAHA